jgi:MbtH protein
VLQEDQDDRTYQIVRNDEEQYSIWLIDRELPIGWHSQGITGPKAECLAKIAELWTDLRPLSLRVRHDAVAESGR